MNKIYNLLAIFAISSSVCLAGPESGNIRNSGTRQSYQKSEVFEHMSMEDHDETQYIEVHRDEEKNSSDSDDEKDKTDSFSQSRDQTPSELTSIPEPQPNHDAERAASTVASRYTPFIQFAQNVRTAIPHLLFSSAMSAFTLNEMNDRDGPDASIIPLSGMALLGGFHAVRVIRSGQNSVYSMVPDTVRDGIRTGVSFLPGLAYSTYHYLTDQPSSVISEATKKCVKNCLEKE